MATSPPHGRCWWRSECSEAPQPHDHGSVATANGSAAGCDREPPRTATCGTPATTCFIARRASRSRRVVGLGPRGKRASAPDPGTSKKPIDKRTLRRSSGRPTSWTPRSRLESARPGSEPGVRKPKDPRTTRAPLERCRCYGEIRNICCSRICPVLLHKARHFDPRRRRSPLLPSRDSASTRHHGVGVRWGDVCLLHDADVTKPMLC
jgi:hypothetical protein